MFLCVKIIFRKANFVYVCNDGAALSTLTRFCHPSPRHSSSAFGPSSSHLLMSLAFPCNPCIDSYYVGALVEPMWQIQCRGALRFEIPWQFPKEHVGLQFVVLGNKINFAISRFFLDTRSHFCIFGAIFGASLLKGSQV